MTDFDIDFEIPNERDEKVNRKETSDNIRELLPKTMLKEI